MQTLRFADPRTVTEYPLPISGALTWQSTPEGGWQTEVTLPDLDAGSILAPSLSVIEAGDYRFRFSLLTADREYPLRPVPATAEHRYEPHPDDARVHTAIDCYHIMELLQGARVKVTFTGDGRPGRYLVAMSGRPLTIAPELPVELPPVRTAAPPGRSQMLANPRIARRICSPMSAAMVIATHRASLDYESVVRACVDPATGMYGLWPLAIRAASRYGLIGAVELLTGWEAVLACLQRGLPVVASIRYGAGELSGAPQQATGGHLVVVHGVNGDRVLVNDPAAPHHGSVHRTYPLTEFGQAWFRHRGAAYILSP